MDSLEQAASALRGKDWNLQIAAERFLASNGTPDFLRPFLTDTDWRVRLFAARALAFLPRPSEAVLYILNDRLSAEKNEWVLKNLRWGIKCHSRQGNAQDDQKKRSCYCGPGVSLSGMGSQKVTAVTVRSVMSRGIHVTIRALSIILGVGVTHTMKRYSRKQRSSLAGYYPFSSGSLTAK